MTGRARFLERDMAMIPLGLLKPNPANRDLGPVEDLTDLGLSMLKHGCLEPLLVEEATDGYRIVAGHRRAAAAKLVGIGELPCRVRRRMARADRAAVAAVENLQRRAMAPLEEAAALRELLALLRSTAAVARAVGRSRGWVRDRLALLDLPPQAQQLVAAGQLGTTGAAALTRGVHATGRAESRVHGNRLRGRPRAPRWFGPEHRLAHDARARCDRLGHSVRGRVGTVACGRCWEHAIRTEQGVTADHVGASS